MNTVLRRTQRYALGMSSGRNPVLVVLICYLSFVRHRMASPYNPVLMHGTDLWVTN